MNYDEEGEVINGDETYAGVASQIQEGGSVIVAWSDDAGSHFDILFTHTAANRGVGIQGGIKRDDLFVSIMRVGAFGFKIDDQDTHQNYYGEKLGMSNDLTLNALAFLINGVKKGLYDARTRKV